MKILPFCLLVCLLPVCLSKEKIPKTAPTPAPSIGQRYDNFVKQHIRPKKDNFKGCNEAMKNKIFPLSSCKEQNTFIFATTDKVKSICKDKKKSGLTESKDKFQIAVCTFKRKLKKICEYTEKQHNQRLVVVSCEGGFPVHYQEDNVP
uniref:Ribonuclease 3-like protein n=1 Tax=Fundulus heteroclitus TaxID=8078 RepID=A0A146PGJ2_FUNHE